MKKFILFIFILSAGVVKAQWQQTNGPLGLEQGSFFRYGSSILLSGFKDGYFKSTDEGNSWENGSPVFQGTNVDFFASNSSYLFLCSSDSGIYRSADSGSSWTKIVSGLPNLAPYYMFKGFVANDTVIGVSFNTSVYVSHDNGSSWTQSTNSYGGRLGQSAGNYIMDSGYPVNGIFTSTDLAAWNLLPSSAVICGDILKANDSIAAIGAWSGSMHISRDHGLTWQRIYFAVDSTVTGISIQGDTIVVSGSHALHISYDKGINWMLDTTSAVPCFDILYDHNWMLKSDGTTGVLKKAGSAWISSNTGLVGTWTGRMYSFGNELYVESRSKRYSTNDEGVNWSLCDSVISTASNIFRTDSLILAFNYMNIARSTDNGISWQNIPQPFAGASSVTSSNGLIYISTGSGPYYSYNRGVTWLSILGNIPNNYQYLNGAYIYAENNVLIYVSQNGFFRSTDNGSTWYQPIMLSGWMLYDVTKITRSGLFLVATAAGLGGGIMRSGDDGFSWQIVSPAASSSYYTDVAAVGSTLVALNHFVGCFISHDHGGSWVMDNSGLLFYRLLNVSVMGDAFYLTTYGHGVFRRSFANLGIVGFDDKDLTLHTLNLYPNPGRSGEFHVDSDKTIKRIEVFSMEGKKILVKDYDDELSDRQIKIDLPGVYIVAVTNKDLSVASKKAVVLK